MVPGTKLREFRKERKVSQEELAVALGRTNACHVSRMEGRELTDLQYAEAVAAVLKVVDQNAAAATPAADALKAVSA